MFVRIIDENGLFVEDTFVDEIPLAMETITDEDGNKTIQPKLDDEGNTYPDPHYIEAVCPDGFILPKWNGIAWIEGGIPAELTEEQKEQRYKDTVVSFIREQYTADDEQAILRKKIAGIDDGEFDVFNVFAEDCKVRARDVVFMEDNVVEAKLLLQGEL